MTPWRIVFMGTPDFAVPALQVLLDGPEQVVGVFTQPDRRAGRGMRLKPSPIKALTLAHNQRCATETTSVNPEIVIHQPKSMRDADALADLVALKPDLIVVAAYGQILPQAVLDVAPQGCINVHASLLPRWRGAAPIQRAIMAGDATMGVTIMQVVLALDAGDMLSKRSIDLDETITGGQLHDAMMSLGGELLAQTIAKMRTGGITPIPQPEEGVTSAAKITPEDGHIDWSRDAQTIDRTIRALDPWPGAWTTDGKKRYKLFGSRLVRQESQAESDTPPGTPLKNSAGALEIVCGRDRIAIAEIQPPGKRRMAASDWLRGHNLPARFTF